MYKIEKNIPAPGPAPQSIRKYPFDKMQIGDSFFVPGGNQNSIATSATNQLNRYGRRYTTRKMDGGVRVWRIA